MLITIQSLNLNAMAIKLSAFNDSFCSIHLSLKKVNFARVFL